jgi:hypothetical protein
MVWGLAFDAMVGFVAAKMKLTECSHTWLLRSRPFLFITNPPLFKSPWIMKLNHPCSTGFHHEWPTHGRWLYDGSLCQADDGIFGLNICS